MGLIQSVLIFGLLCCNIAVGATASPVQVTLTVEVPPHFKETDGIYISGNNAALGNWRADALMLDRTQDPQLRTIQFELPAPGPFEFKFSLGTWEEVEVTLENVLMFNRKFICTQSCARRVSIANFRLKPFHPWPQSTNGRIEYFHDWIFPGFSNRRTIAVYLPFGYSKMKAYQYPVIYALDGQNLFDRATASFGIEWNMDETLDLMIQKKIIPPVIVVGIYSTERRSEEYLFNKAFLQWVARDIKGFVDRRYRTLPGREYTTLLGSSFGGVFAFFAAWLRPDVFSRFGALSTAYWWNNGAVERMVQTQAPQLPVRFWMDMGDQEGGEFSKGVEEMNCVYSILSGPKKWPAEVLKREVISGGRHDEASWAKRLDQVLIHLVGPQAWRHK